MNSVVQSEFKKVIIKFVFLAKLKKDSLFFLNNNCQRENGLFSKADNFQEYGSEYGLSSHL